MKVCAITQRPAVDLDPRNFYTLQQLALSYKFLRRYAEEASTLARALSIKPADPETKEHRRRQPRFA